MSYERPRRKPHESSKVDDETRLQLSAAQQLVNQIKTTLERYHNASDETIKQEAFVRSRALVAQLRKEYNDLVTKIDVAAGDETGYIIAMLLLKSSLEESEYELDLLS